MKTITYTINTTTIYICIYTSILLILTLIFNLNVIPPTPALRHIPRSHTYDVTIASYNAQNCDQHGRLGLDGWDSHYCSDIHQ